MERSTGILPVGQAGVSPAVAKPAASGAALLIGDQAIRFREIHEDEFQFWDLGEHWKKFIGLPFVYALWMIRPEVADAKSIAQHLRELRDENLANIDDVITDTVAGVGDPGQQKELNREFLGCYYRKYLQFGFAEEEKEGLKTFAKLCARHGLLEERGLKFDLV